MNLYHSFLISHVTIIILLCGGGKLGQNIYGNEAN